VRRLLLSEVTSNEDDFGYMRISWINLKRPANTTLCPQPAGCFVATFKHLPAFSQ
jgi:hypothetical protein